MKIEKRELKFDEGTEDERTVEMIVVDKESYNLRRITEADVGKTFMIAKKPTFFTKEQWKEIRRSTIV